MIKIYNRKKRQLQAIRYAESEALFTSIGDGAIATDEKGRVTRINEAAMRIFNLEGNVIGEKLHEIFITLDDDGQIIEGEERPLAKVLDNGQTISSRGSVLHKKKDGPIINISSTISPFLNKDKIIGAIIIVRDITELVKIEQMKNEFISLASHQLRTPLSSISTFSHMIVDGYMGKLNEEQIKIVKTIIKSANRMNGVISSLMSISKIDNNAVKFIPKKTNITQMLDGVFHENRVAIEEKDITYINLSDKNEPCIIVNDPILITEIVNNLISNAVRYTLNGGRVTAKAYRKKNGVAVEITDTGIGILKKDQDKIFDKFFRAPTASKQETFGSGLGLYIVKGFLDIIGGTVKFKTIAGEGTVFKLYIPDLSIR